MYMVSKPSSLVTDLRSAESTPFQAFSPSRGSVRGGTTEPWQNSVTAEVGVSETDETLMYWFLLNFITCSFSWDVPDFWDLQPFFVSIDVFRSVPLPPCYYHVIACLGSGMLTNLHFPQWHPGRWNVPPNSFKRSFKKLAQSLSLGSIDDFGARRFRRTLCLMVCFWWSSTFCCVSWRCRCWGVESVTSAEFTQGILGALWQRGSSQNSLV